MLGNLPGASQFCTVFSWEDSAVGALPAARASLEGEGPMSGSAHVVATGRCMARGPTGGCPRSSREGLLKVASPRRCSCFKRPEAGGMARGDLGQYSKTPLRGHTHELGRTSQ